MTSFLLQRSCFGVVLGLPNSEDYIEYSTIGNNDQIPGKVARRILFFELLLYRIPKFTNRIIDARKILAA
jgi:hypothetical protein